MGYSSKRDAAIYMGERAIRWDASGNAATELGHLGTDGSGSTDSRAFAITTPARPWGMPRSYDAGIYKGRRAVRWDASDAVAIELDHFGTDNSGYTNSQAFAINAPGIAVGYASEYNLSGTYLGTRAVAWTFDGIAINLNAALTPDTGWISL